MVHRTAKLIAAAMCVVAGLSPLLIFNVYFGPVDTFPRQYKTLACTGGSHSVAIYRRKRSWLSPMNDTEVILRVYDAQGNVVRDEVVTSLDLWDDIDSVYPEISCDAEKIRMGGGGHGSPYEVRLANLNR
jgi:hypothetical protein